MEIQAIQNNQNNSTFHGKYRLNKQAVLVYNSLNDNVRNSAYCLGIPKSYVLKLIEKSKSFGLDHLSVNLMEQFRAIFNLFKIVKDPNKLKEVLHVSNRALSVMQRAHERALKEQKMVNTYLEENCSRSKIADIFDCRKSTVSAIFSRWNVLPRSERRKVMIKEATNSNMNNTELSKATDLTVSAIIQIKKELKLPLYTDYIREVRNPEILRRLLQGEKKEVLAKEFGLTISSLKRMSSQNNVFKTLKQQRDQIIIDRIKQGCTSKEIARDLGISIHTVNKIRRNLNSLV